MRQPLLLLCAVCVLALVGCTSSTSTTTTQPAAPAGQPATGAGQPAAPGQPPAQANASPAAPGVPGAVNAPAAAQPNGANTSANAAPDACALLTSAEIKDVQGEDVKETKASQRADAAFAIAQCFYTTPTFTKSVSLEVTRPTPGGRETPREFWREHFTAAAGGERERERERERDKDKDKDKDKDRDKERGRRGEEEEEEGAPPERVRGLGDEAYWVNSRIGGALYVLKGDKFIRVGVGGADSDPVRQKKARALAQKALARL